jgi:UDP-N-acetylglucosamine acyltransferase
MTEENETRLGSSNLIMIGVHIGHDVTVADNCVISNYTQVSGHCKIETGVWLSGMVAIHQFVTIGKWAYAAGFAGINHDIPPFVIVSGHYPPEIRSINKRGLVRAGLSEEQQELIEKAFKKIYRNSGTMLAKAKAVLAESQDENVQAMCNAIIKGTEHRFGRYLEQFRH